MKKHILVKKGTRRIAALLLLAVIAGLLIAVYAVYHPVEREKARRAAAETFADIILPMADDSAVYFCALDSVRAYVSREESLEHALDTLERAENDLRARQAASGEPNFPEESDKALKKAGISPEEFRDFSGARSFALDVDIWCLVSLREYLEEKGDEFEFDAAQYWTRSLDVLRDTYWGMLYYMGVNRWFVQWDEEETGCVQEQILDRLPADFHVLYPWETELSVIERKINIFQKYREMYYEIPMGFTAKERETAAGLREGYGQQGTSIFPEGSWLYSLSALKSMRESALETQRLIERTNEHYGSYEDGQY